MNRLELPSTLHSASHPALREQRTSLGNRIRCMKSIHAVKNTVLKRARRNDPASSTTTASRTSRVKNPMELKKCASTVKSMGIGFIKRILKYVSRVKSEKGVCVCCLNRVPFDSLMSLPCEHTYCRLCIRQLTFTTMEDERLFPPRCCTTDIPMKTVLSSLSSREKVLFMSKIEEVQTSVEERWYCPAAKCGKWISPKRLRPQSRFQKCPYCRTPICPICRGRDHPRQECPKDPTLNAVFEHARLQRWQRCYKCHTMVELISGCNHITCRCRAEFCYQCGRVWDTCRCLNRYQFEDGQVHYPDNNNAAQRNDDPETALMAATVVYAEMEEALERERQERLRQEERLALGKGGMPLQSHFHELTTN